MIGLLKEPIFNTLRTQEQLGYIVSANKYLVQKVIHFAITVQSGSYDADFLEHRINAFIESYKDWEPTKEQVDTAVSSTINSLKQKSTSLAAESSLLWGHILTKEFDFDMREQKIQKYEKLTPGDI